jgi:hypothetical protein
MRVLFALYLASCSSDSGPERVAAHGTVRLGGELLASGQIRFVPSEGATGPAAAASIQNGQYAFSDSDGPIVATHRIEIEATNYLGFEIDDEQAFASFAQSGGTRDRRRTLNPVPQKYNVQSSLTRAVDRDTDPEFDFDLEPATPVTQR